LCGVVVTVCWLSPCFVVVLFLSAQLCYCVSAASMLCVWNKCQRACQRHQGPKPSFGVVGGLSVECRIIFSLVVLKQFFMSTHKLSSFTSLVHGTLNSAVLKHSLNTTYVRLGQCVCVLPVLRSDRHTEKPHTHAVTHRHLPLQTPLS